MDNYAFQLRGWYLIAGALTAVAGHLWFFGESQLAFLIQPPYPYIDFAYRPHSLPRTVIACHRLPPANPMLTAAMLQEKEARKAAKQS